MRDRRLHGLKFRRQAPVGPFIVDFYCAEAKLIVELDGSIHTETDVQSSDKRRENYLREGGYVVFRCTNDEVNDDIEEVLRKIVALCPLTLPSSPLWGERVSPVRERQNRLCSRRTCVSFSDNGYEPKS